MTLSHQGSGTYRLAMTLLQQAYSTACRQCRDALEEYCLAQLAHDNDKLRSYSSTVAAHLDVCVDCAECYELLYTILLPGAVQAEPERYPAPVLGFLAPPPEVDEPLRTRLAQACEHYGEGLRLTFSQALLALLPPRPQLALRSSAAQALVELHMSWPNQPIEALHLQVLTRSESLVDVHMHVYQRERQWPDLLPTRVMLSMGTQRYEAHSDPFGEALLLGLPRDGLATAVVEIDLI